MNYHGAMNPEPVVHGFWDRLFHTSTGVLSTRFAAAFVLMAGVGVALMSSNALRTDDREGLNAVRLRLARRGLLLYAVGLALNHAWGGTIIFYYGAYLLIAALIVGASDLSLVTLGAVTITAAAGLSAWLASRPAGSERIDWLDPREIDTVPDLIGRTFTGYTHPVLPWIAFFIVGIVIGRHLADFHRRARSIALFGSAFTAAMYLILHVASTSSMLDDPSNATLFSTEPFRRGLGYSATTIGIIVTAFALICLVVERLEGSAVIRFVQRAGQMTLSAYLLHVLVYYALFRWWSVIDSRGLSTALIVATMLWIAIVVGSSAWRARFGLGPAERLYRLIGG
jgi:uncharacterized protein